MESKMKKRMRITFNLIAILSMAAALSGCGKSDKTKLELYVLRHVEGSNEFVRDEKPAFTGKDIKSYEWKTHAIAFTDEFLPDKDIVLDDDSFVYGGSQILGIFSPDQFAFYLDGEELYRGYMKPPAFVSFMPAGPMISDSEKGIEIGCSGEGEDVRDNEKLYEYLKDTGLLKK